MFLTYLDALDDVTITSTEYYVTLYVEDNADNQVLLDEAAISFSSDSRTLTVSTSDIALAGDYDISMGIRVMKVDDDGDVVILQKSSMYTI